MNPRQHTISTHLHRLFGEVLPGGNWHVGPFSAKPCPAENVAIHAMLTWPERIRMNTRGYRKA